MAAKNDRQMKEIRSNIGDKIRCRRASIGMTRKTFSEAIGLSQGSISNIENGKQSLTAEKLWHIALVLDCTLADLFPPIPNDYKSFEKQLHEIEDEKTRGWAQELVKLSHSS